MEAFYKIGDTIYLQYFNKNEEQFLSYKAKIADISESFISIEMPYAEETGKIGFFIEGTEVEGSLFAQDGSQYSFKCIILGRKKERIPLTLITHPYPDSVFRRQRRQFVRVPCSVDAAIHSVEKNSFPPFLARTLNISGGGFAFYLKESPSITEGNNIIWWLNLTFRDGLILHPTGRGKIIRVIPPEEKGLPYKISVEFTEIKEGERLKIIKYTFEKQVEIRKKMMEL